MNKIGMVYFWQRAKDVGVIVDPCFTRYSECRIVASSPFCAIFTKQYQWLIENIIGNIILNTGGTIIWIWT